MNLITFILVVITAIFATPVSSSSKERKTLNFFWELSTFSSKFNTTSCTTRDDGSSDCKLEPTKTALITGGAGFVGRHFTKRLCENGFSVTIVDNLVSEGALRPEQWPDYLKCNDQSSIIFIEAECQDFFKDPLSYGLSAVRSESWDLVVHLAALIGGRQAIEDDSLNLVTTNLEIDASAFKWASKHAKTIGKFIYFSSSAVYPIRFQGGNPSYLVESMVDFQSSNGTNSNSIGFPDMGYGWSKLVGEYLSNEANIRHGLNVAVFRPMSGYGEDQSNVYPFKAILSRVLDNKDGPIELWSDSTRDFMHIDDMVSCVLSVNGNVSSVGAINLGSGIATSFSELAALMHRTAWGVDANVSTKITPGKPRGVAFRVADASKMKRHGCSVNISLMDGISRTIRVIKGAQLGVENEARGKKSDNNSNSNSNSNSNGRLEYSRMHCLGGSQDFDNWDLQHTHDGFPSADTPHLRVCKMENVCIVNEQLVYYENPSLDLPESAKMSVIMNKARPFMYLGYKYATVLNPGLPVRFIVSHEPMPSNIDVLDDRKTYLLTKTSNDDNFGHLLFDNLLPALAALELFNVTQEESQLLFMGCYDFPNVVKDGIEYVWGNPYYDQFELNHSKPTTTLMARRDVCLQNYKTYTPLILGHHAIDLFDYFKKSKASNLCFKNVIMGQSSAFSLSSLDLQRSNLIRKARDNMVKRLNLAHIPRPKSHQILILLKTVGFQGKMNISDLCSSVIGSISSLAHNHKREFSNIKISCKVPANQSVAEQVADARQSTIVVAEHGTISYSALYTYDGAVLISIGSKDILKEPHTLLYAATFQTLYMVHDEIERDLGKYLSLAVDISSKNFGI